MAGIYIHIPFCKKRCHYCDFYKTVNLTNVDEFISALLKEIELKKDFFPENTEIKTIYFGGGTPSVLKIDTIDLILSALKKTFSISPTCEITLEMNPDDISLEYTKGLYSLGVNRVSIGVQSFDNNFLQLMNRRHSADQAFQAVEYALKAGIENISIDLIYGLPKLEEKQWENQLEQAFSLHVQHISAYHLTYETGTVFYNWLQNGILKEIEEDTSWRQFEILHQFAISKGFDHYEISNFAKPGKYSRHNSSYWQGVPYLGLGPSAHSYNGKERSWNIADLQKYLNGIANNQNFNSSEILTLQNRHNEYLLTSLRTNSGLNLNYFSETFGGNATEKLLKNMTKFIQSGHAQVSGNFVNLTMKGWFIMDKILPELI